MPPWNPSKTKVQLRYDDWISVQRLRIIQEKKEAQAKTSRRDIATLLESRKIEKARVKVETLIHEDIHVELLELLELYCELLLARFGLLEQNTREPDPGVSEGVCALIHAAPRTELKELHILRDMLMHKYGREFAIAVMENKENCVGERVMSKLTFATPPPALVDAYLAEIAKGYNVDWTPPGGNVDDSDGEGGLKESIPSRTLEEPLPASPVVRGKAAGDTPKLPDLPPAEDEPPAGLAAADKSSKAKTSTSNTDAAKPTLTGSRSTPAAKSIDDEFTALAKRFEALKKR